MSDLTLNVTNVQTIGKGARYAEALAPQVVAAMPTEYDWTKRGAIPAAILTALGLTADTAPKQKTGPSGNQQTTDFGRGVDSLTRAVRKILPKSTAPKPVVLRASLSGEGGGTITIDPSDPVYAVLVAKIAGSAALAA